MKHRGGEGSVRYAITHTPLVVKVRIVGISGGERGIRGFIAAYEVETGKEAWRFYTIPGPGEPGNDTWTRRHMDAWRRFSVDDRVLRR
jgi:alcohol dehydrogenase (cytochrome c)